MSVFGDTSSEKLKRRLNFWVLVASVLLVSNLTLSFVVYQTTANRAIEITPFFGSGGYIKSSRFVDESYLSLMGDNFIHARLNVTPETIAASHKKLKQYLSASHYKELSKLLDNEKKQVVARKLSSYFNVVSIRSDSKKLKSYISGRLRKTAGVETITDELVNYVIEYEYNHGQLTIVNFKKQVKT